MVKLLRERGWLAFRAPGSLGVADVIALRDGFRPRLYESKSTLTPYAHFGPADRKALSEAAREAGADAILAWHPKNGTLKLVPEKDWPS